MTPRVKVVSTPELTAPVRKFGGLWRSPDPSGPAVSLGKWSSATLRGKGQFEFAFWEGGVRIKRRVWRNGCGCRMGRSGSIGLLEDESEEEVVRGCAEQPRWRRS